MSKTVSSNKKSATDLLIMVGTICLPFLTVEVSNVVALLAVAILSALIVYEVRSSKIRFAPIYLLVNFIQWVSVAWVSWGLNPANLNGVLVLVVCIASLVCVINNNIFVINAKP
jgi:hypothetical protein